MNTFAIRDAEASSTTNAPSPDARRWIALAMEMQYGDDARVTDFARTLWRRSVRPTAPPRSEAEQLR